MSGKEGDKRKVHYNTTAPRNPWLFLMCRDSRSPLNLYLKWTRVEQDVTCLKCIEKMKLEGIL